MRLGVKYVRCNVINEREDGSSVKSSGQRGFQQEGSYEATYMEIMKYTCCRMYA